MSLMFDVRPNPNPLPAEKRAAILENPGFGSRFTDHMAVATWTRNDGWHDSAIVPYGPLTLDPAAAVLHYAQEIFEGLKAYRHADGSIWLFRPEQNAERMQRSARRLGLPELPTEDFIGSIEALVRADRDWVPDPEGGESSLYLRPFMFASEAFLGVRAAEHVTYACIASPAGAYFSSGVAPVAIWITTKYSRAGAGGTGAAKCGGNYASSLVAQQEAAEHGCAQVLFADAGGHEFVEELGGMNVYFVNAQGELVTPELSGSILEGVTRDSILALAKDQGLTPVERQVKLSELLEGIRSGDIREVFACGTAAVITPISEFKDEQGEVYRVQNDSPDGVGEHTAALRKELLDIQYGRAEDRYGWMYKVA
ncbi:branched-chain amino acid aminotransferase [Enemella evansiae]|uniref:Branched-chain-amino-acid aminotransferase n=1 Tax=Enemella evansiae TaxID=2016499 RepID=A0A255G0V6_9ACTN|nr:branched-chain amino acid aminotransferase [Enemella evansiae]PFG66887.1 branched-chain amino acid aminotransferase [Propionibacteriaceae bacterium ES.041]OYO00422.1 branched chain amino acid aminotransferase [Enemella evansiae]OYO02788.1 branched chain amino acid aminotransferase [Enemella evansiae]OYO05607.1 branched chain amino acid aminotransferase [Enemella evansiae]OYO09559.1 branched chain amino acid aminotransferase [Enemella evansiae]